MASGGPAENLSYLVLLLLFLSAVVMSIYELESSSYKDGLYLLLIGLVGLWSIGFHKDTYALLRRIIKTMGRKARGQ